MAVDDEGVGGERGLVGCVVAEVVVRHRDRAVRGDADRRGERLLVARGDVGWRLVDLDRLRPRQPAVGRLRKRDAIVGEAAEATVLPDDVQVAVAGARWAAINRDLWNDVRRPNGISGI